MIRSLLMLLANTGRKLSEIKLWIGCEIIWRRCLILRLSLLTEEVAQREWIVEAAKQVGKAKTDARLFLGLAPVQQEELDGHGHHQCNLQRNEFEQGTQVAYYSRSIVVKAAHTHAQT